MSVEERFDAIIIGAGPAGSACAYVLAKAGKSVLLVERGDTAGSKNVTGGRVYTYALEMVEPGLFAQAPLERKVVREQIMMLSSTSGITIDYVNYEFGENVPQSYTVLRAPFDEWFAGQAEAQGAMFTAGILVDELIEADGKIVGIKAGGDEMYADVVIAADGVNSFIAQKAGLLSDIAAHTVGVGAKEIIQLPPDVIQNRFNLGEEEGVARVALGASAGVTGGGFFYTNKDSISLGLVLNPEELARSGKKIHDLLQEYKLHPAIYPLIKDGTTIEYGAHLVPELGFVYIDRNGCIHAMNEKAKSYFLELVTGQTFYKIYPWFRNDWLNGKVKARLVKTSQDVKVLMDIIPDPKQEEYIYLLFKNVDEYRNLIHLWCEVEDSLIRLQPFIDNSYDGVIITNGDGTVRAINHAFSMVSGLTEEDVIGKTVYDLSKQDLLPECSMMHAIERRRDESSVVKFPHGKETVISSKLLCDKQGNIIRVLSNVRDITELENLHEKLRSAEAIAKHYQHEFNAKIASESSLNLELNRSRIMGDVYELVKKVADTDLPLLILGESGVGKTALAKYIHAISERNSTGSFVHINCSAIPEALLESELFGYEAGAFTGAKKAKVGLFEIAEKGTILLDEIGDMPLSLQAKLLNVLQEKKFYRVGGTKIVEADVRVLAATNQNLEQLVAGGRFRRDLYFRLNVIPVTIPALRERKEDIVPLLAYFLEQNNQKYKCSKVFSSETLEVLLNYEWPGNIREIINVVERLVILTKEDIIEPRHLSTQVASEHKLLGSLSSKLSNDNEKSQEEAVVLWTPGESLKETVSKIEGRIIEEAISFYGTLWYGKISC
ncbi:FAD-dependent oxidoreductase [Sporomusa acidovorans]|uniref:Anaerobic nitric oxide reductase transcription regulator NorR n=1 Tax=Sporomusa acidovorans (strain ATCC 49682 / DSM 3132 / Mol) TaxID=1123286 RepID=A0ABZ3J5M3_SPOA4|nr:FAD-dependent oxidoreductase [Sporomusa acidovorans]OZC24308.1 nitrogen assimilation regulatory protein [Sporomusa acidovorans DSM 3132]SDF02440.1 PAS domain S-box-containing protein [Sporomusa acidovorans]